MIGILWVLVCLTAVLYGWEARHALHEACFVLGAHGLFLGVPFWMWVYGIHV